MVENIGTKAGYVKDDAIESAKEMIGLNGRRSGVLRRERTANQQRRR
jgi:hypothetical protein